MEILKELLEALLHFLSTLFHYFVLLHVSFQAIASSEEYMYKAYKVQKILPRSKSPHFLYFQALNTAFPVSFAGTINKTGFMLLLLDNVLRIKPLSLCKRNIVFFLKLKRLLRVL